MKHLKFAVIIAFASATVSAQDLNMDQVPENLKSKFTQSYSNTKDVEWEKQDNYYKVEFEIDRMDHDVWYDAQGKVVKSEIEIAPDKLPASIASVVKNKYSDYKIDSAEIHEKDNMKTYKIEIEKGWLKERKMIIDADGKIISDIED